MCECVCLSVSSTSVCLRLWVLCGVRGKASCDRCSQTDGVLYACMRVCVFVMWGTPNFGLLISATDVRPPGCENKPGILNGYVPAYTACEQLVTRTHTRRKVKRTHACGIQQHAQYITRHSTARTTTIVRTLTFIDNRYTLAYTSDTQTPTASTHHTQHTTCNTNRQTNNHHAHSRVALCLA